jgi:hypothetical protein
MINSKRKNNMNKSKLIATSALATVMSASAAYAELSLSGAYVGNVSSGDGSTGVSQALSTSSVYVTYSSTLDNGMGMSAGFSITDAAMSFSVAVDTGMGSISTGDSFSGAVDSSDSMKAGATAITSNTALAANYNDGDALHGSGVMYTSPSMNGWSVKASVGESNSNANRVQAFAVNGAVMGVAVSAGQVSQATAAEGDDNFITLGYSVAGVDLGYGQYDSDGAGESTVIGANYSVAGLNLGYTFEDHSPASGADTDQTRYNVGKDLGGIGLTLQYSEGSASDSSNWNLLYSVGF